MNKGRRDFLRWKSCERKARYETEEAAYQQGQTTYRCRYCHKWHRTGGVDKLAKMLRK
jgi:hypothetical protein